MLYLVDASIYVFRAWFSLPETMTDPGGRPINALYGFARFLGELLSEESPARIAVAFDQSLTSSFRNEIYPAYKANRPLPPPELEYQFALCRRLCRLLGLAEFASSRFEADDIIGTLTAWSRRRQQPVTVVSADKDLAQLLREGDVLLDPARSRRLGYRDIAPEYGVRPEQIIDLLALTGDAVDNIPGVPGIGRKTAVALLAAFSDLDEIYASPERIAGLGLRGARRIRRILEEHRETALLARRLVTISEDADVAADAGLLRRRPPDLEALEAFYDELGVGRALRTQAARVHERMKDEMDRPPQPLPLFRPVSSGQPADWYAIAEAVTGSGGPRLHPQEATPVSGGSINGAFRVRCGEGWCFVKCNGAASLPLLEAEAAGLEALDAAGVVRVPRPLCAPGVADGSAYLVLEWIDLVRGGKGTSRQLGTALAALHRVTAERFGWAADNYIGASPQPNGWAEDWVSFFAERRLAPQFAMAREQGHAGRLQRDGERLMASLGELFAGYRPLPSLLHGDLWAGNWAADTGGRPVLFDPAVHYGDRECDLAMTELFGGFDGQFYAAYAAAWRLDDGYGLRRDLYQLYHVLNHLNLFGGGYLSQARRLLDRLLAALG